MKKINTKQALLNLKGEEIKLNEKEVATVGYFLGEILLTAKDGGKMKLFTLAQRSVKEDDLELDDSDFALIKSAVEKSEGYTNIVTGQILTILENIK